LKARGKPYYRQIEPGLHLGYRRRRSGSGTWETRHYIGDERYQRERIGTADDASDADGVAVLDFWQAQEKSRKRMVARAHAKAGKPCPLTVDLVMADYLAFIENERKDILNARKRVSAFILPHFGGREAASLTSKEIVAWHRRLAITPARIRSATNSKVQKYKDLDSDEAKRRRKVSANRVLTVLKAALNRAFENEELADDKGWRRVKPFKDVEKSRGRFLTLPEARRLINGSSSDFRHLLQAALFTGGRYSELARLTVADFNPGRSVHGSGKRVPATVSITESKSGKPRHVYLSNEGVQFFAHLTIGRDGDEPMLKRANGAPWKSSEQGRPMRQACDRAKIFPAISFHGMRHTYASLALMNGTPLFVIARNLGHTDTRMVEKHYGHLAKDYEADAIRAGAPTFGFKPESKTANTVARL
jgi:integrase